MSIILIKQTWFGKQKMSVNIFNILKLILYYL